MCGGGRFPNAFDFPDYSYGDMAQIFIGMAEVSLSLARSLSRSLSLTYSPSLSLTLSLSLSLSLSEVSSSPPLRSVSANSPSRRCGADIRRDGR